MNAVRSSIISRHPLFALLLVGAVIRLALLVWFWGKPPQIYDEKYLYSAIASNLAETSSFGASPEEHTSLRPPLYPAFVAIIYKICGNENYDAVRIVQTLLSLVLVAIIYRLGCIVFSERVGLWAGILCCFYPSLLVYNNLILTEFLFTLLLCAGFYLLALSIQRGSLAWIALAGFILGLAALTRSILWLYAPVLCFVLLLTLQGTMRQRVGMVATLALTFVLTLTPWTIRNTLLQKTLTVVDATGGRNFMMGNYPYTPLQRAWTAIDLQGDKDWAAWLASHYPEYFGMTQGQRDKLALRAGLRFVLDHPVLTLQRDINKFFDFWQLERELPGQASKGFFGPIPGWCVKLLSAVIILGYVFCFLTSIFGIFLAPPSDRCYHWMLLSVILFVTAMHTLAFGHSRYHLPLMPLLFLYAASALTQARSIRSWFPRPAFLAAVGIVVLFLANWTWTIFSTDLDYIRRLLS
jgi:4-amino-4-deoxy-L-arabinose transferase-like glycosyltransferase